MLATKMFRDHARGLPDLLNWAALVDDGVVLGKDGVLLAGYFYRGPDLDSATDEERNHLTARVNAALARFGSGWATWSDAVRLPAAGYPAPDRSHFPDLVTWLVDAERRRQFTREGAHYESEYALILAYTPPLRRTSKLAELIYDDDAAAASSPADRLVAQFRRALEEFEDQLGDALRLRRMKGYTVRDARGRERLYDELVNYFAFCLTGELAPVAIPAAPMYLDAYLGAPEFWPGDTPRVGEHYIACVAIDGFPGESAPNILDALDQLPIAYRWSTRMLYLDQHEAISDLEKFRRHWKQKARGFWSQVFRTEGGVINEDAILMTRQTEAAISDANSALVTYGYYTSVVTLMGDDRTALHEDARAVARVIRQHGFSARIETVNTVEAWLGTLPGHAIPNVRRPPLHTLNLSDLLPLASVWTGAEVNPCRFYPPDSPPLLHAVSTGATPFRFNLHSGDVGHTLVIGPTGAGKSVFLGTLAAQFRRYAGARVTAFDFGRSMLTLALAVGGQHYDLAAGEDSPGLAPLAHLDSDADAAWAEGWVATCVELQTGVAPTPRQKEEIHRAVRLLRTQGTSDVGRSMTDFASTVQDATIRQALAPYTIDGQLGHLLDSRAESLRDDAFQVFEIEELMGLGEKNLLPVLLHLFRRFEQSLDGSPAVLFIDEGWVVLGHPVFREKLREWLKTLRKKNCSVVLATQSLSDAVKSGILDVLMEACPTKVFLANNQAEKSGTGSVLGPRDYYALLGLNDAEVRIVANATPKRHYYAVAPEGRRLLDLGLGPVARAFVAVSDKKQVARVRELARAHGQDWPFAWLREQGADYDTYLETGVPGRGFPASNSTAADAAGLGGDAYRGVEEIDDAGVALGV